MAGTMRRRGFSEAAIAAALLVENQGRCKPPLPESKVRDIARSISRYDPGDDAVASTGELTELLGLADAGKRVDLVRVYGRGTRRALSCISTKVMTGSCSTRSDPAHRQQSSD